VWVLVVVVFLDQNNKNKSRSSLNACVYTTVVHAIPKVHVR
jgi:hypothetical protein